MSLSKASAVFSGTLWRFGFSLEISCIGQMTLNMLHRRSGIVSLVSCGKCILMLLLTILKKYAIVDY